MTTEAITETIKELEAKLHHTEQVANKLRNAIAILRDLDKDVAADYERFTAPAADEPIESGPVEKIDPGEIEFNGKPAAEYEGLIPGPAGKTPPRKCRPGRGRKSTTGYKGVYLKRGRYVAMVQVDGKPKQIGAYKTPELAAAAVADHEDRPAEARRLRKIASGQDPDQVTAAEIARKAGYRAGSNDRAVC